MKNKKCVVLFCYEINDLQPNGTMSPGRHAKREILSFNGETDEECQEKVNKCLTALRKMMEE